MRDDNPILVLLRAIFAPLTILYGFGAWFRNYLYDKGCYDTTSFQIPIISVGNLSVGGTGKTPHVDFLASVLKPAHPATLSRGYGRKTKGFRMVQPTDGSKEAGDEAAMMIRKHPGMAVAVGENRMLAVPDLLLARPDTRVIILDDAYQHRSIKPSLNILLTTYDKPFTRDRVLPLGRLRESRSEYKRADIIIVTKCPEELSEQNREKMLEEIKPHSYQKVYFSRQRHQLPRQIWTDQPRAWNKDFEALCFSGIAAPEYFEDYVKGVSSKMVPRQFRDHHEFDRYDLEELRDMYKRMDPSKAQMVTTEKDAIRLMPHMNWFIENKIPVWVVSVACEFDCQDGQDLVNDLNLLLQMHYPQR